MQFEHDVPRAAAEGDADDTSKLNVVILYDDAAAGHRAMRIVKTLVHGHNRDEMTPKPHLWRFDILNDPEWYALALPDAINADLLILSTSAANGLSAAVERLIGLCLARKRGTDGAVIALLGPDDHLDEPASPRFRFVRGATMDAGLEFFAPNALTRDSVSTDSVKRNLFPLLAEAFHRMDSVPRWGINE